MKNFPLPFSKNFSSRYASSFQLSLQIWQVGLQRIWGRLHNSLETHDSLLYWEDNSNSNYSNNSQLVGFPGPCTIPKAMHIPEAPGLSPQARALFFCWLVVHLSQYHTGDLALWLRKHWNKALSTVMLLTVTRWWHCCLCHPEVQLGGAWPNTLCTQRRQCTQRPGCLLCQQVQAASPPAASQGHSWGCQTQYPPCHGAARQCSGHILPFLSLFIRLLKVHFYWNVVDHVTCPVWWERPHPVPSRSRAWMFLAPTAHLGSLPGSPPARVTTNLTRPILACSVAKSCLTLVTPEDPTRLLCSWDFPGKNPGGGCYFLL